MKMDESSTITKLPRSTQMEHTKMNKLKQAAKSLAAQPTAPVELGQASLPSKPNDGKPPTTGGDEGGGDKCGTCPCQDCKPKGSALTKTIPALVTMCEDPNNFCSKFVCECIKPIPKPGTPKMPDGAPPALPKAPAMPKIPKPPGFDGAIPCTFVKNVFYVFFAVFFF